MAYEDFLIVAGSYERILYGLKAIWKNEKETKKVTRLSNCQIEIVPLFIFPSHSGCIKSLAVGHRFLASGATDEIIKLYDLKKFRELGQLSQQDGTITSLQFHGSSHLVSASEDGTLCIFRSKDWELLKVLKGHKERVNSVAIHPSGKLALSTGKDKTLRMWDLISGHQAHKSRLQIEADKLLWNQSGTQYAILFPNSFSLFAQNGQNISSFPCSTRILCAAFIDDAWAIFSGEDKIFHFINLKTLQQVDVESKHSFRVRDLSVHSNCLVSCSSDGIIKCWEIVSTDENIEIELVAEHNFDVRLTCLVTTCLAGN